MRSDRWKSAIKGFAAGALFGVLIFQLIHLLMTELLNSQHDSTTKIQIELGGLFIFSCACFGALYGFMRPDECTNIDRIVDPTTQRELHNAYHLVTINNDAPPSPTPRN